MLPMKLHQLFCTVFFCLPALLFAQDPVFSQPLSAPALLNPALAGGHGYSTIRLSHRIQGGLSNSDYATTFASANYYFPKFNGSVGLNFMHDNAFQTIKTSVINLNYGQQFRITENWTVKPALEVGYRQKTLDWSQLTFGDMIDARRGFVYSTSTPVGGGTATNFDFNFGILTHFHGFMLGAANFHVNEPNESFIGGTSPLPRRGALQAAYTIEIGAGGSPRVIRLQPYILYQRQAIFNMVSLGVGVQVKSIIFSVGSRGNNNLMGMLGIRHRAFNVAYTYDLSVSQLTNAIASAHDVTLGWNFRRNIEQHENFVPIKSVLF
jgi:type IX secretion system PorP/SprF family membrane protein